MMETSNDTRPKIRSWNPGYGRRLANIETRMQDRRAPAI